MKASANKVAQKLRMSSSGFTLIELMVTIAVLAIIVSIAAPSISTQLANQRVKSTTSMLVNALKEAKTESRILRQPLTLKYDDDSKVIKIQNIVSGKVISTVASYKYDAKTTITSTSAGNPFNPNKTADATTYIICDSGAKGSSRMIEVSNIGNITIKIGGTC